MEKCVYTPRRHWDGSQLPMENLFKMEDVVGKFRINASPPESIDWQGQKCVAFGIAASRSDIGRMMTRNLEDLETSMKYVLLGRAVNDSGLYAAIPEDLTLLSDNRQLSANNYNFTRDARNREWMAVAGRWLMTSIDGDKARAAEWRRGRLINPQAWSKWKTSFSQAQRELALAVYWGSGQPTRYPELTSLRFRNTASGGLRNILLYEGSVVTRTIYNKSAHRNPTKVVPIWRRMNGRLSRLLVIWVAVIIPFAEFMEEVFRRQEGSPGDTAGDGQEGSRHGYLFSIRYSGEPEFVSQATLREACKAITSSIFGISLNLQSMRHVLKAFIHHFIDNKAYSWAGEALDDKGDDNDEDELARAGEELAGHSATAGRVYYAIETMDTAFLRSMFMCSAVHNMFGLGVEAARTWALEDGGEAVDFESGFQQARQEEAAKQMLHDDLIRAVLPASSKLHPHQVKVLGYLANPGVRDIVYVAPTGAGKSVSFMLPALANNGGQFILIEPTVALQHDMARRLEKAGIAAYVWTPKLADRHAEAGSSKVSVNPWAFFLILNSAPLFPWNEGACL